MQEMVDRYLAILRVENGMEFGGMTLFPLSRDGTSPLRYRVLSETLDDGSVEVREKPWASVPELWLVNRSDDMVFVMDGEEVIGGKQNRMVNASFLIAPRSELMLPVTCVEHGRWHDVGPRFAPGEAAPSFLRMEKEEQVRIHLRSERRPRADQGAVWEAIAARQREERFASPTGALNDLYRHRAVSLAEYQRAFPYMDGAVGLAVALNGGMVGADLFDQPATAAKLWDKLVRSYAVDADMAQRHEPVARERAERLLKRVVAARWEQFPSIGLGTDLRLSGDGAIGSALLYEGTVVHMTIFRIHRRHSQGEHGGIASASARRRMHFRTET